MSYFSYTFQCERNHPYKIMKKVRFHVCLIILLGTFCFGTEHIYAQNENADAIQPYHDNPWYWQYEGEPILLVGGSGDDNLWQWTGGELIDHLDLLRSVGGNYVRNTMSDRDPEGDVYAVREVEDGMYDLEQWNEEYWNRLENFLDETEQRDIIVQLTLWDEFDFNSDHPYHPENNVNWEPGTIEDAEDFYGGSLSENIEPVLEYQHRYIDKLVSISMAYDHILYNIQNESSVGSEWENYWAQYLKEDDDSQKQIHITSMQLLPGNSLRHVMTNRDLYSFVDVSQNNQNSAGAVGHQHYENLIHWRKMIEAQQEDPVPINNVKIYGSGAGENIAAGTEIEAIERFWRDIFAGAASMRFHRLDGGWGIGLSDKAQHTLNTVTMFLEEFDVFNSEPYAGCKTLGNKISADYCLANVGNAYAVYFPFGRSTVVMDPWVYMDEVTIKWLNVTEGEWDEDETVTLDWAEVPWSGPDRVLVLTPGTSSFGTGDSYIAIIEPK